MSLTPRPEIRNKEIFGEEPPANSEVKVYYLSPEELKQYRGEEGKVNHLERLREKYPDLNSLMASKQGKSFKQWEKENGCTNPYFYSLQKEYLALGAQEKQEPMEEVIAEEQKPIEEVQEVEYADQYIVDDDVDCYEFSSIEEALLHIKTQYTLTNIGRVRLYKEIPFNMNVSVTVGK